MNRITYGLVLFSVLMALSFGIAFAEMGASETPQKDTVNNTSINESLNATANETLNQTETEAAATQGTSPK